MGGERRAGARTDTMIFAYGPWRPDAATLNSEYLSDVTNVLLADGHYIPSSALTPLSAALGEDANGGIQVFDATGAVHVFVGTATKLWKYNSTDNDFDHVSKLGSDQALTGDFASDTNWTKDTGASIAAGVCSFSSVGDGDGISQSQSFTAATAYKVKFTVSNYSAGGVHPELQGGTTVAGTSVTADGTYTQYLTAVTGNNTFALVADGTTTLDIDDVSVEPLANYNTNADDRWRFALFGDYVVAVNPNGDPQYFELNISAEFVDLPGSPGAARNVAVWGDHLALIGLASDPSAVKWSDTNDISEWSAGNSGSQSFPDGGAVYGSSSGTNPIIVQRSAIRFGTFVPGTTIVFTFVKVHDNRGAVAPYSICQRSERVFFADAGGFYQVTPDGMVDPIGFEKIDRTIFGSIGGSANRAIVGEIDPFFTRVYFAVQVDSGTDIFDVVLVYDWSMGEWTKLQPDGGILFPLALATSGMTLAGIAALYPTLEEVPFPFGSPVWQGGAPRMGCINADGKMCFFSGDNDEATITTSEYGGTSGGVMLVRSIGPVTDAEEVYVTIGSRMKMKDAVNSSSELAPSTATGVIRTHKRARFHRFTQRIPAATEWSFTKGLDIDMPSAGGR